MIHFIKNIIILFFSAEKLIISKSKLYKNERNFRFSTYSSDFIKKRKKKKENLIDDINKVKNNFFNGLQLIKDSADKGESQLNYILENIYKVINKY